MSWYAQRGSQRTTHNTQHTILNAQHTTKLSTPLPPPLRALLQLSRLQATTHPARSILSPPLSDPFSYPCAPPAVVVVWYYHILCNSKRLKYCYCCLAKEQAGWGPEVFDRNNAWLHTMDAKSNQEQKREEKFTFLFEWQTSSDRFELVYQQSATFGGTIVMPFLEFFGTVHSLMPGTSW